MKIADVSKILHSDPEILGGTAVFVGTRVPVQSLFDHLKAGESIDDFLEGFPSVRREQRPLRPFANTPTNGFPSLIAPALS
jgi:uncharacterized protein (DUF433 family)